MGVIKITKPVRRITKGSYSVLYVSARPIVVGIEPGDIIAFREKGRRAVFTVPIDVIFRQAVRAHAARVSAEKRAKKKNK
jgi:hypothetical protein